MLAAGAGVLCRVRPASRDSSLACKQALEETEAYLRQLEAEGRASEVYAPGKELLVLQPCYVVKTRELGPSGRKVFINVCSCDKARPHPPFLGLSSPYLKAVLETIALCREKNPILIYISI